MGLPHGPEWLYTAFAMETPETHPDVIAARALGKLAMVAVGARAPWPSAEVIAACGQCYRTPAQLADGRWLGTRMCQGAHGQEVFVYDGATTRTIPFDGAWEPRSNVRVAPSATRLLAAMSLRGRGHLVEHRLDGAGGWSVVASAYDPATPSHLYGTRENLWAADYLGGDDLVVAAATRGEVTELVLLGRTDAGWSEVSRVAAKGLDPVSKGRCVIVRSAKGAEAYGLVGEGGARALVKLGKLDPFWFLAHPADTREQLWGHHGEGANGHLMVCEDLALAKKLPRTKRPKGG